MVPFDAPRVRYVWECSRSRAGCSMRAEGSSSSSSRGRNSDDRDEATETALGRRWNGL